MLMLVEWFQVLLLLSVTWGAERIILLLLLFVWVTLKKSSFIQWKFFGYIRVHIWARMIIEIYFFYCLWVRFKHIVMRQVDQGFINWSCLWPPDAVGLSSGLLSLSCNFLVFLIKARLLDISDRFGRVARVVGRQHFKHARNADVIEFLRASEHIASIFLTLAGLVEALKVLPVWLRLGFNLSAELRYRGKLKILSAFFIRRWACSLVGVSNEERLCTGLNQSNNNRKWLN